MNIYLLPPGIAVFLAVFTIAAVRLGLHLQLTRTPKITKSFPRADFQKIANLEMSLFGLTFPAQGAPCACPAPCCATEHQAHPELLTSRYGLCGVQSYGREGIRVTGAVRHECGACRGKPGKAWCPVHGDRSPSAEWERLYLVAREAASRGLAVLPGEAAARPSCGHKRPGTCSVCSVTDDWPPRKPQRPPAGEGISDQPVLVEGRGWIKSRDVQYYDKIITDPFGMGALYQNTFRKLNKLMGGEDD